jgi:hypothetical protein
MAFDFEGNEINLFSIDGPNKNEFEIQNGNMLILKNPADFEIQSSYSINVTALDNFGHMATATFQIDVLDGKFTTFFFVCDITQQK